MTQRRIRKDLQGLMEDPLDCAQISPDSQDYKKWEVQYYGPPETPYEDFAFLLGIKFPTDYPFKPPDIRFKTKIFHINVSKAGKVCLKEILDEWSPKFTMKNVLEWLDELMCEPDRGSAISNEDMIDLFMQNRDKYDEMAKQWTQKFAIKVNTNNNNNNDDEKSDEQQPQQQQQSQEQQQQQIKKEEKENKETDNNSHKNKDNKKLNTDKPLMDTNNAFLDGGVPQPQPQPQQQQQINNDNSNNKNKNNDTNDNTNEKNQNSAIGNNNNNSNNDQNENNEKNNTNANAT